MICKQGKVHDPHWIQYDTYDLDSREYCRGRTWEATEAQVAREQKKERLYVGQGGRVGMTDYG